MCVRSVKTRIGASYSEEVYRSNSINSGTNNYNKNSSTINKTSIFIVQKKRVILIQICVNTMLACDFEASSVQDEQHKS